MAERSVEIVNKNGIHARPAAEIVKNTNAKERTVLQRAVARSNDSFMKKASPAREVHGNPLKA